MQTTYKPNPNYISKSEIIKISAVDLLAVYKENEVKADSLYKGKVLEITGTVNSIGKDILDNVYITINDGDKYSLISVQAYFSKSDEIAKTAELKAGDNVKIWGKCDGESLNVIIKNCEIK